MSDSTYNILSLDGGGLRGLITAVMLERLSLRYPALLDNVDLVVGTSTGGILALALAKGLPPSDIKKMYLKQGEAIFNRSMLRRVGSLFSLTKAKYDNAGLRQALLGVFGNACLSDLSKKVAVTAFDLDNNLAPARQKARCWAPKVFHNFQGADSDGSRKVVDVALYTSAAPSFFPSVDGYIDGGVVANNPSMVALAQALDSRLLCQGAKSRELSRIRLLSVGTGVNLNHLEGQRHDWGVAEWAEPLLNILLDGVSEVADFQCGQILRDNYCRLQVDLPRDVKIAMDDTSEMGRLCDLGSVQDLTYALSWLTSSQW
jgi:patatin-like phospholipase/acyl hydrolase